MLSTVHANDAPGTVTRLVDMGVPRYLVGSAVVLVMAQRLVRRVCERCKELYLAEPDHFAITPRCVTIRIDSHSSSMCVYTVA